MTNRKAESTRAIAYTRVSTGEQAASGLGLEAQTESIRVAADRLGITVAQSFQDAGVKGATPIGKRPGLLDAIAGLSEGDILLVAKRDRLGRDPILLAMLERLVARKGARIVSAAGEGTDGDDPTNILMRRIIDAFSEYERLLIGARTRAALAVRRRSGLKNGGATPPYGYDVAEDGCTLVESRREQIVICKIIRWRAEGRSLSLIARDLNGERITAKGGGTWNHSQVQRVLRREGAR